MFLLACMRHTGVFHRGIRCRDDQKNAGNVFLDEFFFEMGDLAGVGKFVELRCKVGADDRHVRSCFKKRERLALSHNTASHNDAGPFAQIQICGIVSHDIYSALMRDSAVAFMSGYFWASVSNLARALSRPPNPL